MSRVACMRLLDCVTFSARPVARTVLDDPRPTPCLPPPATIEVKPSSAAGLTKAYHPATRSGPSFIQQISSGRPSHLTPRITRPPATTN